MRYKIMTLALVFFLISSLKLMALEPISSWECRGGDGPTPLNDISAKFIQPAMPIETMSSVLDFLHWPKKGQLIYRNDQNLIHSLNLKSQETEELGMTDATTSRLVNPTENIILQDKGPRFLDLSQGLWKNFTTQFPISHHLYWNQDAFKGQILYSLSSIFLTPSVQTVDIYSYAQGESKATSCQLPTEEGEIFHVASGHEYPYVYLYQIKERDRESEIAFYRVRLEAGLLVQKCALSKVAKPIKVAGSVKRVQYFKKGKALAILTDHPQKNLVWLEKKVCLYYDFKGRKPIFLQHQNPMLSTWSMEDGLEAVFLNTEETASILPLAFYTPVTENDLLLTQDGKNLYINTRVDSYPRKQLYSKNLN